MAARKKTTEEKNEQQAAATPAEQTSEQEEGHGEDAREQTPETVETPEASADPETDVEALESLSVLADRHRMPSWQQAALCRFMGWAEGKLVSDAEYRDALENLKRRRLCGGRAR